jgi:hypothetical protein
MAKTYEPIQTQTLGTATATVTFSSIPQTYTDLVLVLSARITTGTSYHTLQFNSDSATNYSRTNLSGNGTTASSSRYTSETSIFPSIHPLPTAASTFDINITNIMNYSNSTTYKTILSRGNVTGTGVDLNVSLWRSTAAITNITVTSFASTYTAGSTFTLYGIKAA